MKLTPAMIAAAHDVTMQEAGIILSHDLITKIYEAMQAQAKAEPLKAEHDAAMARIGSAGSKCARPSHSVVWDGRP